MRKYPYHLISSNRLGHKDSSLSQIGDVLPNSGGYGQAAIGLYFNVKTLNLYIEDQMALFVEAGLMLPIGFIFNTQNAVWQLNLRRFKQLPTSPTETAVLIEADGSETVYTWDDAHQGYFSPRTGAGRPILQFDKNNQYWVLYHSTQNITEVYNQQGFLSERFNKGHQKISFEYDAQYNLNKIKGYSGNIYILDRTAQPNGDYTVDLTLQKPDNSIQLIHHYAFTSTNLLTQSTRYDFINNKQSGYTTTYHYASEISTLEQITQDDGTLLGTIISEQGRHITLGRSDGEAEGGISFEIFNASSNTVRVAAGVTGYQLDWTFDANGRLVTLTRYAGYIVSDQSPKEITQFSYNDFNEINQIIHPDNTQETRTFDHFFGFMTEHRYEQNQKTLSRTQFIYEIDTNRPQLITKVMTVDNNTVITRHVNEHKILNANDLASEVSFLRYIVSPEGRATANRYDGNGNLQETRDYTSTFYSIENLKPDQAPSLDAMQQWEQQQIETLPTAVKISTYCYDLHGLVSEHHAFTDVDNKGVGIENETSSSQFHFWNDFGKPAKLQTKIGVRSATDPTPVVNTQSDEYDYLQRLISSTDELGNVTKHEYSTDTHVLTCTTTLPNQRIESTTLSCLGVSYNSVASANSIDGILQHRTVQNKFDPNGRIYQTQLPGGLIQYSCCDAKDQLGAVINQAGQYTEHNYAIIPNGRYEIETQYSNVIPAESLQKMAASYVNGDVVKNDFFKGLADPDKDRTHTQFFDGLERLVYEIDAESYLSEYRYDELNLKTAVIHYARAITSDELNSLVKGESLTRTIDITQDRWSSYYYDRDSNPIGTIDPDGWVTEKRYNASNNVIEEIAYATPNRTLNRTHQFADMRPAADNKNDAHHFYFYDGRGQVILSVDPEGYITQLQYSSDGLIQQRYYFYNKVDVSWYQDTSKIPNLPLVHAEDRIEIFKYDNKRRQICHYFVLGKGEWTDYDVMNKPIKKKYYDTQFVTEKPSKYDYDGDHCRITEKQYDGWSQIALVANSFIAAQIAQIQADPYSSPPEKDTKIKALWKGSAEKSVYDDSGLMLSHINSLGEKTLFYYDSNHRLLLTIDAEGAIVENVYNNFNEINSVHHYLKKIPTETLSTLTGGLISDAMQALLIPIDDDPVATKIYDQRGLLSQTIDGERYTTQNYYNAFHELRETHLPIDSDCIQIVKFTHDLRGNVIQTDKYPIDGSQVAPISTQHKYENLYAHLTHSFDENNNQTQFYYDRLGNNIDVIDVMGNKIHRDYDAYDRKISESNELSYVSTFTYGQQDRSVTTTKPSGAQSVIVLNIFNEEVNNTTAVGGVTTTIHNVNAQIVQISVSVENKTRLITKEYDTEGKLKGETEKLGDDEIGYQIKVISQYDYNHAGILVHKIVDSGKEVTNLNVTTIIEPDTLGRTVTITNPRGVINTQKFNKNNLLIYSVKDPGTTEKPGIGYTETQQYNARGDRISLLQGDVSNPNQYAVRFLFDAFARPVGKTIDPTAPGIVKPLNITELNTLDAKGHVVAHKDPNGHLTRYFYDSNDNQRFKINASGGVEEWEYDAHNRKIVYRQYAKFIDISLLIDKTRLADLIQLISDQQLKSNADNLIYFRYDQNNNERFVIRLLYDNSTQKYQALIVEKRYNVADQQIMEIGYYQAILFDDINNFTYEKLVSFMPQYVDQQDRKTYYILDELGQKRFIIDPEKLITEHSYDLQGRIIREIKFATPATDPEAMSKQKSSELNIPTNLTDDRITYSFFNVFNLPACTIDAEGKATRYEYDGNQNLIKHVVCGGDDGVLRYNESIEDWYWFLIVIVPQHFNNYANTLRITQYIYDNQDQQQHIIDACSNQDEFVRDSLGLISQHIDRAKAVRQYSYDRAKRVVLSTLLDAQLIKLIADNTQHLSDVNETRDIQKYTEYDLNNNVKTVIKDYQQDERIVYFTYTPINLLQTAQVKNVSVDDPNIKSSLSSLPLKKIDITSKKVYDGKGQCVAQQKGNGTWDFFVNDNLNRSVYILHQEEEGLSVIELQRNTFGEIVKKARYASQIKLNVADYINTGVPIDVIQTNLKLNNTDDRTTHFLRDHRGSIVETRKNKIFFHQPDSKEIDSAEPVTSYINNIFGERRLISRNRFPKLPQLDVQIFKWYNRCGLEVAQVEAIQDFMTDERLESGVPQFRVQRCGYTLCSEKNYSCEFAEPLLDKPTLDMTLKQLDQLCHYLLPGNRKIEWTYNKLGQIETEETTGPNVDKRISYFYTPVEKIQRIQYETFYPNLLTLNEYRYYNAQQNEIARVGIENFSYSEFSYIRKIDFRTLTLYGYNSYGQKVRTQRYANGTGIKIDPNQIPDPLNPDPQHDEIEKIFYDTRGLPQINQDAENNVTISLYDANKKIARQFWPLTSKGVGNIPTIEHIDEKTWRWDVRSRLSLSAYGRDGNQTQVTQYQYNAFGECIGEGPGNNQFPLYRQYDLAGHNWNENGEKGIATINLYDLQGVTTGQVRSAKIDLSSSQYANLPQLMSANPNLEITYFYPDMGKRLLCKIEPPILQSNTSLPQVPLTVEINSQHATRAFGSYSITWSKIPNTTLKMHLKLDQIDGYESYSAVEVKTYNGITGINVNAAWNLPSDMYRYTITYSHEIHQAPKRRYQFQPQANGNLRVEDINQLLKVVAKDHVSAEVHPAIVLADNDYLILTESLIDFERRRRIAFSRNRFTALNTLYIPILIPPQRWTLLILNYVDKKIELKSAHYFNPSQDSIEKDILNTLRHEALHPSLNTIKNIPLSFLNGKHTENSCVYLLELMQQLLRESTIVAEAGSPHVYLDLKATRRKHENMLIQLSEVHPTSLKPAPQPETKPVYQSKGILQIYTDNDAKSQRLIPYLVDNRLMFAGRTMDLTAIELWQNKQKLIVCAVIWDHEIKKPYVDLKLLEKMLGEQANSDPYVIKGIRRRRLDALGSLPLILFSKKIKQNVDPIAFEINFRAQLLWLDTVGELALWGLSPDYASYQIKLICNYIGKNGIEHIYSGIHKISSFSEDKNKENRPAFFVEIDFINSIESILDLTLSLLHMRNNQEEGEILLYKEAKPLLGEERAKVFLISDERVNVAHLQTTVPHGLALKSRNKSTISTDSDSEWIMVDDSEMTMLDDSDWVMLDESQNELTRANQRLCAVQFAPRTILHITPIDIFLNDNKELISTYLSYHDSSAGFNGVWKQLPILDFNSYGMVVDITLMHPGVYQYKLQNFEGRNKRESLEYKFVKSNGGQLFISDIKADNVASLVAPVWRYGYDVWDNKVKEQDPYSRITLFEYNANNKKTKSTFSPINITDEHGNTESKVTEIYTSYSNDIFGMKTFTDTGDYHQESFIYDNLGQLIVNSFPTSAHGKVNLYNAKGCIVAYQNSYKGIFFQDFDRLRNIIQVKSTAHPAIPPQALINSSLWGKTYSYDQRSQRVSTTDELGHTFIYQYDERGNIAAVIDPFQAISQSTIYHRTNQPQTITYPINSTAPDGLAATLTLTMHYDYFGNLQNKILMNGTTITFTRDFKQQIILQNSTPEANRLMPFMITRMLENAADNTFINIGIWHFLTYESALLTQNITYVYVNGLLTQVHDVSQNQFTDYGYDLLKRRNQSTVQFNDGSRRDMSCTFNARGWQDSTHDSNAKVQTGFDSSGNIRYQNYEFQSGADSCSGVLYSTFDGANQVHCDQGQLVQGGIYIAPGQGVAFGYCTTPSTIGPDEGLQIATFFRASETIQTTDEIQTQFDYHDDCCLHSSKTNTNISAARMTTDREYYPNDWLYIYKENNSVNPFWETYNSYDGNGQVVNMNRTTDGTVILEKTSYTKRDRFGQYNQRSVILADNSETIFENDNLYFENPQISRVRATTHLPDHTEKQLQPAQFFYDSNHHPCGKISNNLADELEKVNMNVLTDSGAIVRKQHLTTSTDHPAYGQVTELAFMGPNEDYFATYTLCDDPRDRGYNNLLLKYPDQTKGGRSAVIPAQGTKEWFGSGRAGRDMRFQILTPVEPLMDYHTPVTFDEYKSFFGGDNPQQGFKNSLPAPMSTFPSNSPQTFVVPSNLNPGSSDMSLAEISQSRFGSPRYAAQIAAANGLPITARCKPGEHLTIPSVQMNSKTAYDNVPYQKIMSSLLGSLSPHLDSSQPHQSCRQMITSIVIDMVAEAIGMAMGNPLLGMMVAAAADAALQEVAVQVGLLNQISWENVVEAGLDVAGNKLLKLLGPLDAVDEAIARASIASSKVIAGQLTEMAQGKRKQLDFKPVVTTIEMTVIDAAIPLPAPSNHFMQVAENLVRSAADQVIGSAITGAPLDVKTMVANMIGETIGSELSDVIQQIPTSIAKQDSLHAQKQTGINDQSHPKTGLQAQLHPDYIKSVARGSGVSKAHDNTYTNELNASAGSEVNDEWELHKSVRSGSNKPVMSANQNIFNKKQKNPASVHELGGNPASFFHTRNKNAFSDSSLNNSASKNYDEQRNLSDKLNEMRIAKKYVVYADAVYSDSIPKDSKLVSVFNDPKVNFHAALYKTGNEYILSYRGTVNSKDGITNIEQNFGYSRAYNEAISLAQNISKTVGKNHLTLVGHSLGGGEAAAGSLVTHVRAVTYNAAGVNPNIVGSFYSPSSPNVTNFYVGGEPLTSIQQSSYVNDRIKVWPAVGKQVELPIDHSKDLPMISRSPIGVILAASPFGKIGIGLIDTDTFFKNSLRPHQIASVESSIDYEERLLANQISHIKQMR